MDMLDFAAANRARCEAANGFNHPIHKWSMSDWFTATMGELGEAANVAKKLNRVRDGIIGNDKNEDELRADLADEIADTFIYLDLLAQSAGINLAEAVLSKFNKTSRSIGYEPMPQLPFPPVSDGNVIDTFGADQHADFDHPLDGQHPARREGDEYVCSRCSKRWDVKDDAPEQCA